MGVLCQPRVGAGLSGIPCLLGVRVILPPPAGTHKCLGLLFLPLVPLVTWEHLLTL